MNVSCLEGLKPIKIMELTIKYIRKKENLFSHYDLRESFHTKRFLEKNFQLKTKKKQIKF